MWHLYILHSKNIDKYYIGITQDIQKRFQYHNSIGEGFTVRGRPWDIVYKYENLSKKSAHKLEKWIKSQKSLRITELIINNLII